jgi:hypothetical protein
MVFYLCGAVFCVVVVWSRKRQWWAGRKRDVEGQGFQASPQHQEYM